MKIKAISLIVVLLVLCGCEATGGVGGSTPKKAWTTAPMTTSTLMENGNPLTETEIIPTETEIDPTHNTSENTEEKTTVDLTGEYQYIKIKDYSYEGFSLS